MCTMSCDVGTVGCWYSAVESIQLWDSAGKRLLLYMCSPVLVTVLLDRCV
jgi:hypothetical protein